MESGGRGNGRGRGESGGRGVTAISEQNYRYSIAGSMPLQEFWEGAVYIVLDSGIARMSKLCDDNMDTLSASASGLGHAPIMNFFYHIL